MHKRFVRVNNYVARNVLQYMVHHHIYLQVVSYNVIAVLL